MKFRLGACAAVVLLAACSGQKSDSQMAALHGSAGGDSLKAQARAATPTGRDVLHSIANAPDRGTLMAYKNQGKPTKREGAFTYYPVNMSEAYALKGVVTGHMTVPMPDGSEIKLNYERHDEGIDGNWTWVGRVEGGDPMQEAIITFGENAVFASIPQGNGKSPLSIRTRGTELYAVQMDPTKVRSPNVGHTDMAIPEASELIDAAVDKAMAAQAQVAQNAVAMAAPPSATNTIDVAVGYTAGFRHQAALEQQSVSTMLTFLLQVANQGLSNSKVNGYLRLVNAQEVAYTDSNSNQTALHELTGSNGASNVAIPATLNPLRAARDQYGADVALLVRGFLQPEQQGCGIAWLIGANGATVTPSQDAKWGYGVVSFGDDLGTDGNSYYCAPESLVHEIGHLLGSAHDQANSSSAGRYPYSYGYKSTAGNFYTIMAYGDVNQTPYRLFSNPNIATCGETSPGPCGVANTADNARSLNQTIPVVAQFRETKVPFAKRAKNDVTGDGKSDLIFRNASAQLVGWWQMDGTRVVRTSNQAAGGPFTLNATGDFNGDGREDLAWTNSAKKLVIFTSTGSGFTSTTVSSNFGASWNLVGAGDVTGDGKTDLIFQNTSAQLVGWWEMNGTKVVKTYSQGAGGAYRLGAVGDFNGDGRADLAWTNAARRLVMFISTGTSFTVHTVSTDFGANWALVGAGDVNGDSVSELLFRNSSAQLVGWWEMNGATVVRKRDQAAGGAYTLNAVGDFNGDGRADLAWTNAARKLVMFTSTGTAFTSATITNDYGANWALQGGGP